MGHDYILFVKSCTLVTGAVTPGTKLFTTQGHEAGQYAGDHIAYCNGHAS